jgi:hypothetical protein
MGAVVARAVSSPFSAPFAKDSDRDFQVRCLLGLAPAGGAEIGEVLAAVRDLRDPGPEPWGAVWRALGDRVASQGAAALAAGRRRSGAAASLRGAGYLALAVEAAAAGTDDHAMADAFRAHRAAWDAFADNAPYPLVRMEVACDGAVMPGYLFLGGDGPRPTVVFVNGSDGSISSEWGTGAAAALERGYNAFLFDGPGQQSLLFEQGITFRPDWAPVLGAVVDALQARAEVDTERLVCWGISQGGYWVPQALASEHRFAAAVADPGVVDVSASWTANMPPSMLRLLDKGEYDRLDREMGMGLRMSSSLAHTWTFRSRPLGGGSPSEVLRAIQEYRFDAEHAARIGTPLLITSPEGEQFWPGQSERLASWIPSGARVLPFTAAEGADLHCEPLARTLVHERVFDALADLLLVD